MLDMGFKPAVDRIVKRTPAKRQTLFFSATLQGAAGKLAERVHARRPPPRARARGREARRVKHRFVHVDSQGAKLEALVGELRGADADRALVFVRTKHGADRLVKRLGQAERARGRDARQQVAVQREKALARFERGDVQTLVATDVAARGIDVPDVSHVINFDAPPDRDSYLHRVGRTGRAGRSGAGVSFVLADQSKDMRRIASDLGIEPQLDGRHGSRDHRSSSRSRRRRRRR